MNKRLANAINQVTIAAVILTSGLLISEMTNTTKPVAIEANSSGFVTSPVQVKTNKVLSAKTTGSAAGIEIKAAVSNNKNTGELSPGQFGTDGRHHIYTATTGDNIASVSKKAGINETDLKWLNGLDTDNLAVGQILNIPDVQPKPLKAILTEKSISDNQVNLEIHIDKSGHRLGVFSNGEWLRSYPVDIGKQGLDDKQVYGDNKTPEGNFYITEKYTLENAGGFLGTRWMRLSYPNIEDADRGLKTGIIGSETRNEIVAAVSKGQNPPMGTELGGNIGIHGGSTPNRGKDWTAGCVALVNSNVEDFYDYTRVGTKVIIEK